VEAEFRKRPGPPPTGKGRPVVVRMQPDLLAALDAFKTRKGAPSRPEAIRRIVGAWLRQSGDLPNGEEASAPESRLFRGPARRPGKE
jgi:hypothetical protein